MTRTQIHLPDDLYQRVKRVAASQEVSLTEMVRRGLEMLLDRLPADAPVGEWKLPTFDSGGLRVPLESLRDVLMEDELARHFES